jgi:hypothetical protein
MALVWSFRIKWFYVHTCYVIQQGVKFLLKNTSSWCLYFWYLKESKAGVDGTISGEIFYPILEEDGYTSSVDSCSDIVQTSGEQTSLKQVRIHGY